MQGPVNTHLDKPCYTCGGVENAELMATCSRCNIAHEHVYCMRVIVRQVPDNWSCEACLLTNDVALLEGGVREERSKVLTPNACNVFPRAELHSGTSIRTEPCFKRKRSIETGRVKKLSDAEAIKLSSGATKMVPPTRNYSISRSGPSNNMASMSRTPISCKAVTPKLGPPKVKANPSFYPLGCVKPPRHGCEQLKPVANRREPQFSKELKEPKATITPLKDYVCKERPLASFTPAKSNAKIAKTSYKGSCSSSTSRPSLPIARSDKACVQDYVSKDPSMDVLIPAKEVLTSSGRMEKSTNKDSCTSSPSRHFPPIISPDVVLQAVAELGHSSVEERGLLNFVPELCFHYRPARDVTWKGGFKIHGEFYGGFCGHPPFRVHPKAYEFSKTLHPVLEVKLLPRHHLWTDLFQDDIPDLRDIALYFLPGNLERSKDNHACLFERMEIQDVAMEAYINGVELLIFTSKKLHMNSQEVITKSDNNNFLWGVFRCARDGRTANEEANEYTSLVFPVEGGVHENNANMADDDDPDMEIDMIGGEIVGSVDVPVPRESSWRNSDICKGDGSTSQTPNGNVLTDARGLDYTIQQLQVEYNREKRKDSGLSPGLTQSVKIEYDLELPLQISHYSMKHKDVPPGFEKMSRLNSRSVSERAMIKDDKFHPLSWGVMSSVKKEENIDI